MAVDSRVSSRASDSDNGIVPDQNEATNNGIPEPETGAEPQPTTANPAEPVTDSKPQITNIGHHKKPQKAKKAHQNKPERKKGEAVLTPNKVLRISAMLKKLLAELLQSPMDMQTRQELAETYAKSRKLVKKCLSPELQKELNALVLPIKTGKHNTTPSEAELRLAYAQLVGWLEGLFGGIQTLMSVQQTANANQLGVVRAGVVPGVTTTNLPASKDASGKSIQDAANLDIESRPGQYL